MNNVNKYRIINYENYNLLIQDYKWTNIKLSNYFEALIIDPKNGTKTSYVSLSIDMGSNDDILEKRNA